MNLSRIDVRMTLPAAPRTALVLGDLQHWREGLELIGVELLDGASRSRPELIVAPAALAGRALAAGSPMVIVEGRGGRRALRASGMKVRRFLPLPTPAAPDMLVPLEARAPTAYALTRRRTPGTVTKRARNAALELAIAAGRCPDLPGVQSVALADDRCPFLLDAATALGVDPQASWFQTMGGHDPLSRGVFHLFASGEAAPRWVVKFARVAGHGEQFDADERGLGLIGGVGGAVAAHAPQLLGRFEAGGLEASAETAVPGMPLSELLRARQPRARRLALVERVADWTIELGRASAAGPPSLVPELDRLRREVLPGHGLDAGLLDGLERLRSVLAHHDLGTWNVLVGESSFGAVDWESARAGAAPLWDLLYFLADALPILDGARSVAERVDGAIAALRGEHPGSAFLFASLSRAAAELAVPIEAVGPLATLCWLHHARSHVRRWSAAERVQPGSGTFVPPAEQIAEHWLKDPRLGPGWPAFVSSRG